MDDYFDYDKIDSFWEWFSANDERIKEVLLGHSEQDKEALVKTLNNQVLTLGMFTWEMGHGTTSPFYLTISPNGDKELLALSREIMAAAPYLPDWELNHAKPALDWDLKFQLYDEEYIERKVDASKWKFSLRQHHEEGVTIILEAGNIGHLDYETKKTATEQVVISLLGEEQKIMYVQEIETTNQLKPSSTPIQQLKQKFDAFIH